MADSTASVSSSTRALAVVTGAASGIGAALVSALAERDLDVVAIDLRTDCIDPRARARVFAVDVRDETGMAAVADFAAAAVPTRAVVEPM